MTHENRRLPNSKTKGPVPLNQCHKMFIKEIDYGNTPYEMTTKTKCSDCGMILMTPYFSPRHPYCFVFCKQCVLCYVDEPMHVLCKHCPRSKNEEYKQYCWESDIEWDIGRFTMPPMVSIKFDGIDGKIIVCDWSVTVEYMWNGMLYEHFIGNCNIPDQTIPVEYVLDGNNEQYYFINDIGHNSANNPYYKRLTNVCKDVYIKPVVTIDRWFEILCCNEHLPIVGLIYIDTLVKQIKPHRTITVYLDNPRHCSSINFEYDIKIASTIETKYAPTVSSPFESFSNPLPLPYYKIGTIVLPKNQIVSMLNYHELMYHGNDTFSYVRMRGDKINPANLAEWNSLLYSDVRAPTDLSTPHFSSWLPSKSPFNKRRQTIYKAMWNQHRAIKSHLYKRYSTEGTITDFYFHEHGGVRDNSKPRYGLQNGHDLTKDCVFQHQTEVLFCMYDIHFFTSPSHIDVFIRNICRATTPNATIVMTVMHDKSDCTYFDEKGNIQFSVRTGNNGFNDNNQLNVYIHPRRRYYTENAIDLYELVTKFNQYNITCVMNQTFIEYAKSNSIGKGISPCVANHPITERYSVLILKRNPYEPVGLVRLNTNVVNPLLYSTCLDVSFLEPQDLMQWCGTCKTIYEFNIDRKCLYYTKDVSVLCKERRKNHKDIKKFESRYLYDQTKISLTRLSRWIGVDIPSEFTIKENRLHLFYSYNGYSDESDY